MITTLLARIRSDLAGRALTVVGGLLVLTLIGWMLHVSKLHVEQAQQALKLRDMEHELQTIRIAAAYQQAKVDAAVANADKDWERAKKELEVIKSQPLPKTNEEARDWALRVLKEGK